MTEPMTEARARELFSRYRGSEGCPHCVAKGYLEGLEAGRRENLERVEQEKKIRDGCQINQDMVAALETADRMYVALTGDGHTELHSEKNTCVQCEIARAYRAARERMK